MNTENPATIRELVKLVLMHTPYSAWKVSPNGRMTLILGTGSGVAAINIFHRGYRKPGTTEVHSHAVDFRSDIIGGLIRQNRYRRMDASEGTWWWEQKLALDGKLSGEKQMVGLVELPVEEYSPGSAYEIDADEIHRSDPEDGTTTLVTRLHHTSPKDMSVFWPETAFTGRTGNAELLGRNDLVVEDVVKLALERWFQ